MQQSLRIVHVLPALRQGGAENQLELLLGHSKQTVNHEHIVVSLLPERTKLARRLEESGTKVIYCSFGEKGFVFAFFLLRKILKQYRREDTVFHSWMYFANLLLVLGLLGLKERNVIWSIRRSEIPKGGSRLASIACGIISWFRPVPVLVNSLAAIEGHRRHFYRKKYFEYIPNGFKDFGQINYLPKSRGLIIGSIGRAVPEKGFDILVRAFAKLKLRMGGIVEVLKLVGRGVPEMQEVKDSVASCGISDSVFCLDEVDDVTSVMKDIDVLCVASRSEGFNNILAEGMLFGLPVVCTDVGQSREIIADDRWVVFPGDVAGLVETLTRMCTLSNDERMQIGQINRQRILSSYSVAAMYQRYINVYATLVEGGVKR